MQLPFDLWFGALNGTSIGYHSGLFASNVKKFLLLPIPAYVAYEALAETVTVKHACMYSVPGLTISEISLYNWSLL